MSRVSLAAVEREYGFEDEEEATLVRRAARQARAAAAKPAVRDPNKPWWDVKLSALSNAELDDLYALACNRRHMPPPYSNHAVETLRAIEKIKRSRVGHAFMAACRPLRSVRRPSAPPEERSAKILPFKRPDPST